MSEEFLDVLNVRIGGVLAKRINLLGSTVREIRDKYTKASIIGGSRCAMEIVGAAAAEYQVRTEECVQIVRQLVAESGRHFAEPLDVECSTMVEEALIANLDTISQVVENARAPMSQERKAKLAEEMKRFVSSEMRFLRARTSVLRRPVIECLAQPRYEAPRTALQKARAFLDARTLDTSNAAKEAVSAAEEMCRILVGDGSLTLGRAAERLHHQGRLPKPVLKGLEEVWAITNQTSGVRHGAGAAISASLAWYIVSISEAAVQFLAEADSEHAIQNESGELVRGQDSEGR